jgi:hypothetical protein
MSSLIGKRIGGQTYYYLREVARVGGKPKIVSQRYLGKAADIARRWTALPCCPSGPGTWRSATWRRHGQ